MDPIVLTISGANLIVIGTLLFKIGSVTSAYTKDLTALQSAVVELKATLAQFQTQQLVFGQQGATVVALQLEVRIVKRRAHKIAQLLTAVLAILHEHPSPMMKKVMDIYSDSTREEAEEETR